MEEERYIAYMAWVFLWQINKTYYSDALNFYTMDSELLDSKLSNLDDSEGHYSDALNFYTMDSELLDSKLSNLDDSEGQC
jgi:hypothetical protein